MAKEIILSKTTAKREANERQRQNRPNGPEKLPEKFNSQVSPQTSDLLGQVAVEGVDWYARAECALLGIHPETFFPKKTDSVKRIELATDVCKQCAVRGQCLEFALAHNEQGIWGGTTEDERDHIMRRRRYRAKK